MTYEIIGIRGEKYNLTPEQIFTFLLRPIDQYGNWFATLDDLAAVCQKPGFPKITAQGIALLVLDRESKLTEDWVNGGHRAEYIFRSAGGDIEGMSYFFDLVRRDPKQAGMIRRYLNLFIRDLLKSANENLYGGGLYGAKWDAWAEKFVETATRDYWKVVTETDFDLTAIKNDIADKLIDLLDLALQTDALKPTAEETAAREKDQKTAEEEAWKAWADLVYTKIIDGVYNPPEPATLQPANRGYGYGWDSDWW